MTTLAISIIAVSYVGALAVGFIVGIYSCQAWQSDNKYQRKDL